MGEVGIPLVLHLRVTLADQVRLNGWLLDQPELRCKRLVARTLMVLVIPAMSLLLGIGVSTVQHGQPFLPAVGWALRDRGSQVIAATVAGLMVALWTALRLVRGPLLRRRLRRLLPERPGVDPADPALTEPVRLLLDDEGFVSETAASTTRVPWAAVQGLADTGTLLVLRTGRYSGFIVPKRDLSAAEDTALRATVARGGR